MFFREYTKSYPKAKYLDDTKPWAVKCDIAFPCATQNELNHADAMSLINVGCQIIIEGKSSCLWFSVIDFWKRMFSLLNLVVTMISQEY